MKALREYKSVLFTWAAWVVLMLLLINFVGGRFSLAFPDTALSWTANETLPASQSGKPYLLRAVSERPRGLGLRILSFDCNRGI